MDTTDQTASIEYDPYRTLPAHYIAARLDGLGVTLVDLISPVDGSTIPGVDLEQLRTLLRKHDERCTAIVQERARPIILPGIDAPKTEAVNLSFASDRTKMIAMFASGTAFGVVIAAAAAAVALFATGVLG
jgi:hypothetical protein